MLKVNNTIFDVGVCGPVRVFKFDEKYRVQTSDGNFHREVRGITKSYQIKVTNLSNYEYENLIAELSTPSEYHTIQLIDNYSNTYFEEMQCLITKLSDRLIAHTSDGTYWSDLEIEFEIKQYN